MSSDPTPPSGGSATTPEALPLANWYCALPGQLLAGEHPAAVSEEVTRARLAALLDAGVRCFIDLTHPQEQPAYEALLPPGITYHRKPLPDHGLPGHPAQMADILDCLGAALRAGLPVYLHCRAGIGRTGMTLGCWLAENAHTGEQAIEALNHLWQQSARSRQWASIPETDAQTDYVRRWRREAGGSDPLLEPGTLAAARGLRERYQGALLGLAAGDAIGVTTQFARPGRFTPVRDLLGGGPFDLPRGAWSDDTAMALCVAESLLDKAGFDAQDQVARLRRWQKEGYLSATGQCVGITAATARALARAQWRRQAFSGSHDPGAPDPESLARVLPVVLFFFADREAALEQAAQAARLTCQAPAVLESCRALAAALHAALSGAPKAAIRAAAASAGRAVPDAAAPDSAAAVLGTALEAFGGTDNYRDAVLAAANRGGPADVAAAVTGALAGAHYSAGAVPTMWRNSLMRLELLEDFADRLLTHTLLEFGR